MKIIHTKKKFRGVGTFVECSGIFSERWNLLYDLQKMYGITDVEVSNRLRQL
jgi:hypothetical protein